MVVLNTAIYLKNIYKFFLIGLGWCIEEVTEQEG